MTLHKIRMYELHRSRSFCSSLFFSFRSIHTLCSRKKVYFLQNATEWLAFRWMHWIRCWKRDTATGDLARHCRGTQTQRNMNGGSHNKCNKINDRMCLCFREHKCNIRVYSSHRLSLRAPKKRRANYFIIKYLTFLSYFKHFKMVKLFKVGMRARLPFRRPSPHRAVNVEWKDTEK